MSPSPDVLERLAAADPVDPDAPVPPVELARIEALVAAGQTAPVQRRPRPRVVRLALAGTAVLVVSLVAVLVGSTRSGVEPARAAFQALSARTGVFHAIARITLQRRDRRPTVAWVESWTPARGGRVHALQYDATPGGARGRLVSETLGNYTVGYAAPRDGGPVGIEGGLDTGGRTDPRLAYLDAYRDGRVRDAGTTSVRIGGVLHRAWRLVAERRVGPSLYSFDGHMVHVPGYRERGVFLVDTRTRALLVEQRTGLVSTERGYYRETTTRRFVRFERLSDRAGRPGLAPTRRFGHSG